MRSQVCQEEGWDLLELLVWRFLFPRAYLKFLGKSQFAVYQNVVAVLLPPPDELETLGYLLKYLSLPSAGLARLIPSNVVGDLIPNEFVPSPLIVIQLVRDGLEEAVSVVCHG